jgi:hypothetical protein
VPAAPEQEAVQGPTEGTCDDDSTMSHLGCEDGTLAMRLAVPAAPEQEAVQGPKGGTRDDDSTMSHVGCEDGAVL